MKTLVLSCLVFVCFIGSSESHNILMMVVSRSFSHKNVFMPLANHLAERQHNVTILCVIKSTEKQHPNVEEIVLQFSDAYKIGTNPHSKFNPFENEERSLIKIHNFIVTSCRELWSSKQFINFVNDPNRHYDIGLIDGLFNECGLPLFHKFGTPYIFLFPTGIFGYLSWLHNVPRPYSYIPFSSGSLMLPDMSFRQRLSNTIEQTVMVAAQRFHLHLINGLLNEICPFKIPHISDVVANASLVFVNEHIAMDYAKPTMPNIINVGGIGMKQKEESLPNDIEEFMNSSGEAGIIVFSFGSMVKMRDIPQQTKLAFKETFGRLQQKVLWKYETPEDFSDLPSNIKLVTWIPQQKVLAHQNCRLFISHGGIASMIESLYSGVPLILIPLFAEQEVNTAKAIYRGHSLYLSKHNLTESSIIWAIQEILNNPRYKANAENTAQLLLDNLAQPLETAEYWINHVIKHKGASHLRNEVASSLYLFQYFLIDVLVFICFLIILVLGLLFAILRLSIKMCIWFRKAYTNTSKKNI